MSLNIRTHIALANTALKKRRGRTFLTCLGIAIGIASIILILSLMGSIEHLITSQLESVGNNLILVRPNTDQTDIESILSELTSTNKYSKSNLNLSDVGLIKNLNPNLSEDGEYPITAVAPLAISNNTLTAERTVNSATVVGTNASLQDILSLQLKAGTFLTNDTLRTAVIGHDLALELFGDTEPIGLTFNLLSESFIVTGVLLETDDPVNFNNVNFDESVIVDITQLRSLDSNVQVQQINVQVASEEALPRTAEMITESLREFKDGDVNFIAAYGKDITHPAGSLLSIVSGVLTAVASIALIVGGIGVMNIMLVAVSERTHEVGIRKAIGATNVNIFLQFLFESLILCILGGIAGIILGYILSFLISVITPFNPYFSINICLAAFGISILVGTLFGLYPAFRASRKNPIDSLKYIN